jgi:hypothetical protein
MNIIKVWNKGSSVINMNLGPSKTNYQANPNTYVEVPAAYEDDLAEYLNLYSDLEIDQTGGSIDLAQIDPRSFICYFKNPVFGSPLSIAVSGKWIADYAASTKPVIALTHAADPTAGGDGPLYAVENSNNAYNNIVTLQSTCANNANVLGETANGVGGGVAASVRFFVFDNNTPDGVQIYVNESSSDRLEAVFPSETDGYIIMPFEAAAGAIPGYAVAVKIHHSASAATGKALHFDDNGAADAQLRFIDADAVGGVIPAADITVLAPCYLLSESNSLGVSSARVATDAAQNVILTADGRVLFTTNIGQQDIGPVASAYGLDITGDLTATDGLEISFALGTAEKAVNQFSNLDDAQFYARFRVYITDISGLASMVMGFRKMEAHAAAYDSYYDLAALNQKGAALYTDLIVNNASTVETDTAEVLEDITMYDYLVVKDDTRALELGILLANNIKSLYNAHCASITAHTTAADATNLVTEDDATDLTSLLTLINDIITQYVAHDGDAELGSDWVYHKAQQASDHSLASESATVSTLIGALAALNDAKTAIDAHMADTTCHGVATTAFTADLISNYFFFYKEYDDVTYTDVSVAGTLLTTDVDVMSTLQFKHDTHISETLSYAEYEQGVGLPFGFTNIGQE